MNNIEIEAKVKEFDDMFPQYVEYEEMTALGRKVTHASLWLDELLVTIAAKHNEEKRQMIQDILKHRNVDGIYASDVKTVAESYGVDLSKTDVKTEI